MSVLSDIADEAVRPIKTGVYITSAVLVAGGVAVAANSKTGRKFLSSVKKTLTSDDEKKPDGVKNDTKEEIAELPKQTETKVIEKKVEKTTQGSDNA